MHEQAVVWGGIGADLVLAMDGVDESVESLVQSAKAGNPDLPGFCNACFTGEYPTGDVTPAMLDAIERERSEAHAAKS